MRLYLVTMEGVYDHGVCGAFANIDEAVQHAQDLYTDSDKHHQFRIEEIDTGHRYWPTRRYAQPHSHLTEHPRPVQTVREGR